MIKVNDVTLVIKKNIILNKINATFEIGKIHGIIGRNGSGKTMLLKSICGLIKPNTGEIIVAEKRVGRDRILCKLYEIMTI